MASPIIAVGAFDGSISWDGGIPFPILHKADSAGNYYPHGHRIQFGFSPYGILGIALDASGNAYLGMQLRGYLPTDLYYDKNCGEELFTLRKVDPYGYTIWGVHHGQTVVSVCLDDDNNVYIFGDGVCDDGSKRTSYVQSAITTRKYDNDGNLLWSADHGFCASWTVQYFNNCKMVYKNGYIYTGSTQYSNVSGHRTCLTKYDSDTGDIVWKTMDGGNAAALAIARGIYVDDDDNVYVAGVIYGPIDTSIASQTHLFKYNSSGVLLTSARMSSNWPDNVNVYYTDIVKTSDDLLVVSTLHGADGNAEYGYYDNRRFDIYDLNLTFVGYGGTNDLNGTTIVRMDIDGDDNIYGITTGGTNVPYALPVLRKYDPTNNFDELWAIPFLDNSNLDSYEHDLEDVYCLAVRDIEYPPLLLEVDLGIPVINIPSISPPGLPITFSFGIPNIIREYIGRILPNIYRATLSGTTAYECAISSFNILKTTESQSLSIVVPFLTSSQITEIESRIGNNIILYRGVKFSSGIEQLELMLSVTFDSVRYDYGANSGSLTLSGSSDLVTGFTKTRAIAGISYRNEINGIRRIRARVDTYLQPGDTADLGDGETLTVAEVTIYINEGSAVMEFTE